MTTVKQSAKVVLRAKDAARFIGIATSTFWRWVQEGRLPQGIRLSPRCTVWRIQDLEKFLDASAEE